MTGHINYSKYIHEYTASNGEIKFAVAEWVESAAEWQCPLDARTAKLSGCTAEFSHSLSSLGGYKTRREALRRARYLFGQRSEVA